MITFTSTDLDTFCFTGQSNLAGAKFVKVLGPELMLENEIHDDHVSTTTSVDHPHTWTLLDLAFEGVDLSESFERPLLIVYDELLPSRILIDLHYWLRRQCLNIENIVVVTTHHQGCEQWWMQWCNAMQEQSFRVVDAQHPPNMIKNYISQGAEVIDSVDVLGEKTQHMTKLFSYYGGLYGAVERDYLSLQMSEFRSTAIVDYLGKFEPKDLLQGYIESISYYLDQSSVDSLSDAYDQLVSDGHMTTNISQLNINKAPSKEKLNLQGLQWEIDKHCFATVVKETKANDRYPMSTEKTWRGFLHHCVVIPTCYQSVTYLEQQGYWFPHDIFDYSYQQEPRYHYRIQKLKQALRQLEQTHTVDDMKQYLQQNINRFRQNAQRVFDISNLKTWTILK